MGVDFDYSEIRGPGLPIKGFGGISSGPEPLKLLHIQIREVLDKLSGKPITETAIVDIMNLIGCCVVAGNVRRCLPAGTMVHTFDKGLVKIEDLVVGDLVETVNGPARVGEVIKQGIQWVLDIRTTHGILTCTPNHRVARLKSPVGQNYKRRCLHEFEWVEAIEITEADELAFWYRGELETAIVLRVSEETDYGACDTYDISVPGPKNFICGPGFVVHNSAEIAFGSPDSTEFLGLKDYRWDAEQGHYVGGSAHRAAFVFAP